MSALLTRGNICTYHLARRANDHGVVTARAPWRGRLPGRWRRSCVPTVPAHRDSRPWPDWQDGHAATEAPLTAMFEAVAISSPQRRSGGWKAGAVKTVSLGPAHTMVAKVMPVDKPQHCKRRSRWRQGEELAAGCGTETRSGRIARRAGQCRQVNQAPPWRADSEPCVKRVTPSPIAPAAVPARALAAVC
ncbi:hypothetical protein RCH09_000897 [Actimicrobium sp. GrIS 1.19]|nr:hypothetical protein [Actimicrobium sp. GrIS 1.19]